MKRIIYFAITGESTDVLPLNQSISAESDVTVRCFHLIFTQYFLLAVGLCQPGDGFIGTVWVTAPAAVCRTEANSVKTCKIALAAKRELKLLPASHKYVWTCWFFRKQFQNQHFHHIQVCCAERNRTGSRPARRRRPPARYYETLWFQMRFLKATEAAITALSGTDQRRRD